MKKTLFTIIVALLAPLVVSCDLKKEMEFSGKTMGTRYHIKVMTGYFFRSEALKKKIDRRLEEINQSMSTYRQESEISRFNRHTAPSGFEISRDFQKVFTVGAKIFGQTEGAWDGTILPLIRLWGFDRPEIQKTLPQSQEIERTLRNLGFNSIELSGRTLRKKNPEIQLDFASIAKGYGVDAIAEVILHAGFDNFLVEIGGEIFASGVRLDGKKWRVGINQPERGSGLAQIHAAVSLSNRALATSGDYRNYFEIDGKYFSHILDPRTGYPVQNGVVSASVLAPDCTHADGLATALMVMGVRRGVELVEQMGGIECLIVVREKDGTFSDHASSGFFNSAK